MLYSRTASLSFLFAAALLLGACGFKPLYGVRDAGTQLRAEDSLALIEVEPIKDRLGQMLHNELLERLNPKGRPGAPRYTLIVTATEGIGSLGVQKSGDATRANLSLSANYRLSVRPESGEGPRPVLASGSVRIVSSYDISSAEFTTLIAARNARTNAVREAADDIRTRLAVFFVQHNRAGGPGAP